MSYGSMPIDNGCLILSKDEADEIVDSDPELTSVVRKYLGAKNFLAVQKGIACGSRISIQLLHLNRPSSWSELKSVKPLENRATDPRQELLLLPRIYLERFVNQMALHWFSLKYPLEPGATYR